MKPPASDYLCAKPTQHALKALAHTGEGTRALARDQSLMVMLSMCPAQPQPLVDISRTHNLDVVRVEGGYLEVSAVATQGNVEWHPSFVNKVPLLVLVSPHIPHFQTCSRGTVRGSITHAGPSAELPLVLTALDEQAVLRSLYRRRMMQTVNFFQGTLMTAHEPDGLAEAVRFPLRQLGAYYGLTEFSARHGGFALMAYVAIVTDDAIALAMGGVTD